MAKRKKNPHVIKLSSKDADELVARVNASSLDEHDRRLVVAVISSLSWLQALLERKKFTLNKLRSLFGITREKQKDIFPEQPPSDSTDADSGHDDQDPPSPASGSTSAAPRKDGGHGKRAAKDYAGAKREFHKHESLSAGEDCPECGKGKLKQLEPTSVIRIYGEAPFSAVNHQQERLRCSLCEKVFTAELPKTVPKTLCDERAVTLLGYLRYRLGLPFKRLETAQEHLGIPLPDSTQWDQLEAKSPVFYAVFKMLLLQAASALRFYKDDTGARIIDLRRTLQENAETRQGIRTSAILAELADGKQIKLFFTGQNHAGENLLRIIEQRDPGESAPLVMCDALSSNEASRAVAIIINCLDHGRRRFVEVKDYFKDECRYILSELGKVYNNDKICKALGMDDWDRLTYHQLHSKPVMEALNVYMEQKLASGAVEHNSLLGEAMLYMLKRWERFCGFYQYAGAPLSNAACERQIKTTKPHYKGSLHYKTTYGALLGDIMMSLIQTSEAAMKNPLDYLTALQKHAKKVLASPGEWLPWNYEAQLA